MVQHILIQLTSSPGSGIISDLTAATQFQQDGPGGIPIWVIIVGALIVITIGVLWVLYEEGKAAEEQGQPQTATVIVDTPASVQPQAVEEPVVADDLTVIEGIGPKISGILQAAGITTFAHLATTEVSRLTQIVREAKLSLADTRSWPEQAALAAAGDWGKLKALQDELKGGRRVSD